MNEKLERLRYLVGVLNNARRSYEKDNIEVMSNHEYDKLYDELLELEDETGVVLGNSPTQNVGYDAISEFVKEQHRQPMLSLDKTKDIEKLKQWLGDKVGNLSWKLDGLTVVLTYRQGELVKAVTRGNGLVGEIVTSNAKTFVNVPMRIAYTGELVIRGEAIIKYSTFNRINDEIEDVESKYKNPRNLCSGSVRQLDSAITSMRDVHWYAFDLVSGGDGERFKSAEFEFLESLGFETVDYTLVRNKNDLEGAIAQFESDIESFDIPSDGLVLAYDDLEYAESLGTTSKFPRGAIAFKWSDDTQETQIIDVEWSVGRTGVITPVAIFNTVELEGTEVSRASLHNVSIFKKLGIGYGDTVSVYKANKIIPQIAENFSRTETAGIPDVCPVCGAPTEIRLELQSEALYCTNENCAVKRIKEFSHFVSRNAMNIVGLSEKTLEKLMNYRIVTCFSDIYRLSEHYQEFVSIEGFGDKLFDKLVESIDNSRYCDMANFIYALGIPNIGLQNAKLLCNEYNYQLEKMAAAEEYELSYIEGIGDVLANCFSDYFLVDEHVNEILRLLDELYFYSHYENEIQTFLGKRLQFEYVETEEKEQVLEGYTFVCTGSLNIFSNRNVMKDLIEELGGKLVGSVSKSTSYLITNDTSTGTTKNIKAQELGVPIITEQEFIARFSLKQYL